MSKTRWKIISVVLSICLFGTIIMYEYRNVKGSRPTIEYRQIETESVVSFDGEITAYTAGFESCGKLPSHPAYGITANGNKVKKGIVAVDTRVLPFGSIIYIEGVGVFTADDTGGDIKGNRIDIYMENLDDAIKFGRQFKKVYVLKKG